MPLDKMLCLVGLGMVLGVSLVFTLGLHKLAGRRSHSPPGDELRIEP